MKHTLAGKYQYEKKVMYACTYKKQILSSSLYLKTQEKGESIIFIVI
jgi:hypothetical protein